LAFDRANITKEGTDDQDVRIQQYAKNGDVDDAEIWAPYGLSYNLPENSLCLFAQIGGDDGNIILLPDRSQDRVKNLKRGEVALFNPLTKSRMVFRLNGDIEIVTEGESGDRLTTIKKDEIMTVGGDKTVTVTGDDTLTVAGKMTITVTGDCDLKAASVNIDASVTNLGVGGNAIARLGDAVQVTGVQSGASTATGTITSAGVNKSI